MKGHVVILPWDGELLMHSAGAHFGLMHGHRALSRMSVTQADRIAHQLAAGAHQAQACRHRDALKELVKLQEDEDDQRG